MRLFLTAFGLAVACSMPPEPSAGEVDEPAGEPRSAAVTAEPVDPPPPPLDPESACGRAEACCQAFAEVTPHVEVASACAGPREVFEDDDADARCERMVEGWRVALETHEGVDVPDTCGASANH